MFAVEGMVKLHFIWRKQTGTRGDSRIERLAFTYRANINFEQKSNEFIGYNLMNILKSDIYICELFSRFALCKMVGDMSQMRMR